MPSAAKKPGETDAELRRADPLRRSLARSPRRRTGSRGRSRRRRATGTRVPTATCSTPGSSLMRRMHFLVEAERSDPACGRTTSPARCSARTLRVSKPGGAACSAISVVSSMPAPASSTNDAAICVTANSPQPAVRARRDPHAAARQAEAVRRVGRRQPRHERQQDGGDEREADADPQQARVDASGRARAPRSATRSARGSPPSAARSARRAARRRRTGAGSPPAACAAARRCWRRAPRGSPARLRGAPSARGSGSRRSSTRSRRPAPTPRAARAAPSAPAT